MKQQTEQSGRNDFLTRRRFAATVLTPACALCASLPSVAANGRSGTAVSPFPAKEALHYEKLGNNRVRCDVCPRECEIADGSRGFCGTRENRDGTLYTLVYGRVASLAPDPIEKKPFYHVIPGSPTFSIATAGCNMWCKFCQNHTLSQAKPVEIRSYQLSPERIAAEAKHYGSRFIAYTYNEPTIFTEFAHDCAAAGQKEGIGSIVISNGYINPEPLDRLSEVINAYKVDLKAFSKEFYTSVTGGRRDDVLATIKRLKANKVWTELVHLTIPTLNDNDGDFAEMAGWLMGEIGPDIPVHFTRFRPMYKLTNLPVTPTSTLERARDILMDHGLRYVYVGNVPGHKSEATYCPSCGKRVIGRIGFTVTEQNMKDGSCSFCGEKIAGVWSL